MDKYGPGGQRGQESTQSIASTYAEISTNGVLALIAVASSLLNRQLASIERTFVEEGGFTERLYRVRKRHQL
jgi:four helix bundle suffix protein